MHSRKARVIKVIGVGGCGGNAVNHMIEQAVNGVEFVAINTDAQALRSKQGAQPAADRLRTDQGLGAGAKPEIGQAAALEDRERIAELLEGVDMVFINRRHGRRHPAPARHR